MPGDLRNILGETGVAKSRGADGPVETKRLHVAARPDIGWAALRKGASGGAMEVAIAAVAQAVAILSGMNAFRVPENFEAFTVFRFSTDHGKRRGKS